MSQYRYPGTQPFSTGQRHLFFGRDDDIARLHRLVKTQPLVVLYGKSGLGKSSLLNAGLVPEVLTEAVYTPLHIRFNAWTEDKGDDPVGITLRTLSPAGSRATFLDSLISNERSLWHELKEAQLATAGNLQYLLVFDQFEELFTYPPAAVAAFKEQLAEAIYTKIPQRYREILEKQVEQGQCALTDAEFDQLQAQPNVRMLLSIRADRMHLMERLSDALPDILSHCYELAALSPKGAEAAIAAPAALQGDFQTPAYAYTPAALSEIIAFLDDADGRIETVQLQILCRNFEERARAEGIRLLREGRRDWGYYDITWALTIGRDLQKQKNYEAARPWLEYAHERDPWNSDILVALADTWHHLKESDAAVELLKEAVEHNPRNSYLWEELAVIYCLRGELTRANECFDKSEEIAPYRYERLLKWADALVRLHQYRRARKPIQRYLMFMPDDPVALALRDTIISHLPQQASGATGSRRCSASRGPGRPASRTRRPCRRRASSRTGTGRRPTRAS